MKELVEFPSRASSVHRWAGVPISGHRNNIAEHSFGVSFYCLVLYRAIPLVGDAVDLGKLLNYAMIHDLPEVITGDLPSSIKQRAPEIKSILDTIEEGVFNNDLKLINIKPDAYIKFIVKVADFICVKLEHDEELKLGNTSTSIEEAKDVIKRIYKKLFYGDHQEVDSSFKEQVQIYLERELNWTRNKFVI